jgi:hypothetical protein
MFSGIIVIVIAPRLSNVQVPNAEVKHYLSGSECFFSPLKGPMGHGLIWGGLTGICTAGPCAILKITTTEYSYIRVDMLLLTSKEVSKQNLLRWRSRYAPPAWRPSEEPPVSELYFPATTNLWDCWNRLERQKKAWSGYSENFFTDFLRSFFAFLETFKVGFSFT